MEKVRSINVSAVLRAFLRPRCRGMTGRILYLSSDLFRWMVVRTTAGARHLISLIAYLVCSVLLVAQSYLSASVWLADCATVQA